MSICINEREKEGGGLNGLNGEFRTLPTLWSTPRDTKPLKGVRADVRYTTDSSFPLVLSFPYLIKETEGQLDSWSNLSSWRCLLKVFHPM